MRVKVWMVTAVLLGGSTLTGARMRAQTSGTSGVGGTVKDDLFAGTEKFATNASSVTEVDMDPDSMGLVSGSNTARARRTVLSVVHTYSYDKPGMYNMADVDAFRNKLNTGDWHCSVHVRELKSGESTDVCNKRRTDDLIESAIITVEPKELTFIHTIKRRTPDNKPGGGESLLSVPFEFGLPLFDQVPSAAYGAEMRAYGAEMRVYGAEMRAQGAVSRAEMAAVRPEMAEQMAELRANMAGLQKLAPLDEEQLKNMTKASKGMQEQMMLTPAVPAPPPIRPIKP